MTGGSTGIGRELVLALARRGVQVAASARSASNLVELAALDKNIFPVPVDVTDRDKMAAAYAAVSDKLGDVDLAILNAGTWDPMSAEDFDALRAARSMNVNYNGITNALELLMPAMIARKSGHIAMVASVAGYRGLPKAAGYAPSKAAIISLAETLRFDLPRHNVDLTIVNPGFVDTPMTAVNEFPMPYMISADDAAKRILAGLERRVFEIAFPWQLVFSLKLMRILPYSLYFALATRFTRSG